MSLTIRVNLDTRAIRIRTVAPLTLWDTSCPVELYFEQSSAEVRLGEGATVLLTIKEDFGEAVLAQVASWTRGETDDDPYTGTLALNGAALVALIASEASLECKAQMYWEDPDDGETPEWSAVEGVTVRNAIRLPTDTTPDPSSVFAQTMLAAIDTEASTVSVSVEDGLLVLLADGGEGSEGDSAYEVAVAAGFVGTVEEWLESLAGETGETGPEGPEGPQGPAGTDGDTHVPDPSAEANGRILEVQGGSLVYANPSSGGSFDPASPGAIGGTTPSTGTFTSVTLLNGGTIEMGGTSYVRLVNGLIVINGNSPVVWGSNGVLGEGLMLFREADNILGQRNGANAQTQRIYRTYTDASNYERATVGWSGSVLEIGTEAAGTGTLRLVRLLGIPTADPAVAGCLWSDAGTLKISAG